MSWAQPRHRRDLSPATSGIPSGRSLESPEPHGTRLLLRGCSGSLRPVSSGTRVRVPRGDGV